MLVIKGARWTRHRGAESGDARRLMTRDCRKKSASLGLVVCLFSWLYYTGIKGLGMLYAVLVF